MVAEKLDRIDDAEAKLRRLVELKPDDAQALNALGYTLVDRTTRAEEGCALIERAHKLSPDDPFILDSMGWALFRLGPLDEAETYLLARVRRAARRRDRRAPGRSAVGQGRARRARRKSGSRSSRHRPTTRCCSRRSAGLRAERADRPSPCAGRILRRALRRRVAALALCAARSACARVAPRPIASRPRRAASPLRSTLARPALGATRHARRGGGAFRLDARAGGAMRSTLATPLGHDARRALEATARASRATLEPARRDRRSPARDWSSARPRSARRCRCRSRARVVDPRRAAPGTALRDRARRRGRASRAAPGRLGDRLRVRRRRRAAASRDRCAIPTIEVRVVDRRMAAEPLSARATRARRAGAGEGQPVPARHRPARRRLSHARVAVRARRPRRHDRRSTVRDDGAIVRARDVAGVPADDDLALRAARALRQATGCRLGVAIDARQARSRSARGWAAAARTRRRVLLALNRLWSLALSARRARRRSARRSARTCRSSCSARTRSRAASASGLTAMIAAAVLARARVPAARTSRPRAIFAAPELTRIDAVGENRRLFRELRPERSAGGRACAASGGGRSARGARADRRRRRG